MAEAKETVEKDATKTTPAPESTWGASEDTKAAWARKYGKEKK